jgi:hypothetical protein
MVRSAFFFRPDTKVAPKINITLRFIFNFCHTFCGRTPFVFFTLRGYGGTHFKKKRHARGSSVIIAGGNVSLPLLLF